MNRNRKKHGPILARGPLGPGLWALSPGAQMSGDPFSLSCKLYSLCDGECPVPVSKRVTTSPHKSKSEPRFHIVKLHASACHYDYSIRYGRDLDLWPLTVKGSHQCPLKWWIFVSSFIQIPVLCTCVSWHAKRR